MAKLQEKGAFEDFDIFLEFATLKKDKERLKWPEPNTPQEREEYLARWEQFKRLAPVWVELKLLSP